MLFGETKSVTWWGSFDNLALSSTFLLSTNGSWKQPCRFTRARTVCVGQLFCRARINTADFLSAMCISGSSLLWHKVSWRENFIRDLLTCTWTLICLKSEGLVGITQSRMCLCWRVFASSFLVWPERPLGVPRWQRGGSASHMVNSLPSTMWGVVFTVWRPPRTRLPCPDTEVLPAKTTGKT